MNYNWEHMKNIAHLIKEKIKRKKTSNHAKIKTRQQYFRRDKCQKKTRRQSQNIKTQQNCLE